MMKINRFKFDIKQYTNKPVEKIQKKSVNLCEKMFAKGIDHKLYPEYLPKNFKYKGKYYVHYAAEKQDMTMFERALKAGHDLSLLDNKGNNLIHHLFNEEISFKKEEFKLIEPSFFNRIINNKKNLWNPSKNTFDFFRYFKSKTISILEDKKELVFDEDKYNKIILVYKECIELLKNANLELKLSLEDFENLKFNSTIQGRFIEDALLIADEKKECFQFLIRCINLFCTPKPDKVKPKEVEPFFGFNLGDFSNHVMIMGSTGSGKSIYLAQKIQQMLNAFVINPNNDNELIYEMWENHILKNNELNKYLYKDEDLFSFLQSTNKALASLTLNKKLSVDLSETKKEYSKRIKV